MAKKAQRRKPARREAAKRVQEPIDTRPEVLQLLRKIKRELPELEMLLEESSGDWTYEDAVYRLFHGSNKVYFIQSQTQAIVDALRSLGEGRPLNATFLVIIAAGTGKGWDPAHNRRWLKETRPMLEAFFLAKFFLEMAVRYGKTLTRPPLCLPSGWAAILYLYNLR